MGCGGPVAGVIGLILLILLSIFLGLYFTNKLCPLGSKYGKENKWGYECPEAPAPVVTTPDVVVPDLTPLETLKATGQALQVAEIDISTSPPAFTAPTGMVPSTVTYTMSMDINIAQSGPSWRNIFNNGDPDWPPGTTSRRPALFITGNDAVPANRLLVSHSSTGNEGNGINTTFAATLGTFFNLTWVVSGGKLTTYINGQKDATGEVSGAFTWATANAWKWNAYKTQYPTRTGNVAGGVFVKNVYWWNKALTTTEIDTLTTVPTTTSAFMAEPTTGVSAYTKESHLFSAA
jgi:hypothetical protein